MEFTGDIAIETTKEEDVSTVLEIESRPENTGLIEFWSAEEHKNAIVSDAWEHFVIRSQKDNQIVGYIILEKDKKNLSLMFRRIAVYPKGAGLGRSGVEYVLDYCFKRLGYHRLWLNVRDDNTRAMKVYEELGFAREGTSRDAIRVNDTEYRSYIVMSMLDKEYKAN